MKVMMFVVMKSTDVPKPPTAEALLAMHTFNQELEKAGVLVDLGGLKPPSSSVRVHYRGTKRTVVDGPFAEAKEIIAGYSLLEVSSLDEAIAWAKRSPFGQDDDDSEAVVELRPLFDPSEFDVPGEAEERAQRRS